MIAASYFTRNASLASRPLTSTLSHQFCSAFTRPVDDETKRIVVAKRRTLIRGELHMLAKSHFAALALCLAFTGCAPKEMFSWIDRNCFVADWTNHHSCLSCCGKGCGQAYPNVEYPMLVLGNQPDLEGETPAELPGDEELVQPADENAAPSME
jgi:hypothetical protein